ncbi:hypothetical protein NUU61_006436 [Penicillium alfredii]|uniref:Phosphoglycerate mutase family protein n=1 Tax=Penicillium alfredii TaxID=1506179 RepID=A0A9W9F135_9EURO|nr:uncharacterized protein NUU61_006436 [Penicillium alfredii]KAJ5091566.1 hypothetical protein NUU61_006436 [Penicillium alfredii]
MRLFLIRHAETVHNVGQDWAGTTDSALTNHGVQQIECLAQHFFSQSIQFSFVFASDLSRARITAEGICCRQTARADLGVTPTLTKDLRERDFGPLEGVSWGPSHTASGDRHTKPGRSGSGFPSHTEPESEASMVRRAQSFLNEHLLPVLLDGTDHEEAVAVVSHGVFLRVLWNCVLQMFNPMNIQASGITSWDGNLAIFSAPSWSNTGFLTVFIQPNLAEASNTNTASVDTPIPAPQPPSTALLHGWSLVILGVNSKDHLTGLHRTRGGIGSAAHDTRQKRLDQFFK